MTKKANPKKQPQKMVSQPAAPAFTLNLGSASKILAKRRKANANPNGVQKAKQIHPKKNTQPKKRHISAKEQAYYASEINPFNLLMPTAASNINHQAPSLAPNFSVAMASQSTTIQDNDQPNRPSHVVETPMTFLSNGFSAIDIDTSTTSDNSRAPNKPQ